VKRVVIGGPTLSGLLLVVAWQTENSAAIVAALCALCVMTPPIGAALAVLLASSVPEEIYGRTTTASSFVAELLQPFGPLAAGILLARFTMGTIAAALAVALIATGALALMLPAQPAVAATEDPTPSTRSSQ
jgi:hypothetical protein